jgi:GNAT superfamily N-acetyltransferase
MLLTIRQAVPTDVPALETLIRASVLGLQAADYTPEQLQLSLERVFGVDTRLIQDGTYFVAEAQDGEERVIAGCGGWSKRKTLYGSDHCAGREDALLDPERDAAKIRAFFVHPGWARRGVGSRILQVCETAAAAAGFHRLEMGATLTGVPL